MAPEARKSLAHLQANLSSQHRDLLDHIWNHFKTRGEWISTKSVHQQFGKPAVLEARKRLGGSIVFVMSERPGKERYQLTLLGVLLTSEGQRAEDLIAQYLEYLRQRFKADPDVENVTSEEARAILKLTPEDTKILGCLIDLGRFWGNTSSDLGRTENWSAGVPTDIDDLPVVSDLGAYVRNRALEGYDPNLPVGASERMSYKVMKERDAMSQGTEALQFETIGEAGREEEVSTGPKRWDAFICHAGEDKAAVVEPLAAASHARGLQVWYDRWELKIGDSLRRKIEEGLANSRFGIVILSPAFFGKKKEWPQKELDALVQKEVDGEKVILPVWHGLSRADVAQHSLLLADRVAGSTENGIDILADELLRAMGGQPKATPSAPAGVRRVKDVGMQERLAGSSVHPPPGSQPILEEAQRTRRGLLLAGAVAVTVIVLILVYILYAKSPDHQGTVEEAFRILEDLTKPERTRLDAFHHLRERHEWKDFKGRDLSNLELPTYGWSGLDLTEAKMRSCILRNANLRDVVLVRADLTSADLRGADMRGGKLNGVIMIGADCREATFDGVPLRGGVFRNADFGRANLRYTFLQATDFSWASLVLADLYAATFDDGDTPEWHRSVLTGANFGGAGLLKTNLRNTVGINTVDFTKARYDGDTKFPEGFSAEKAGMLKE